MKAGNKLALGAFVLGALGLAIVGVGVLGSGAFFRPTQKFVMYFDGSVSGLSTGAPVVFRGVRIGSVEDIRLVLEPGGLSLNIPVFVELDMRKLAGLPKGLTAQEQLKSLIDRGLRAQLVTQSFVTGQLMVSLDFFPEKTAVFRGDGAIPEIPTVPTVMQQLARKLEDLPLEEMVNKIVRSVDGLEALINSPEIKGTLNAMERSLEELGALARNLNQEVGPVAAVLKDSIASYGALARNIDTQATSTALEVRRTLEELRKLSRDIESRVDSVSGPAQKALNATQEAMVQASSVFEATQKIVDENSPLIQRLIVAMEELALASRSIRSLADFLERHPEALIYGKGAPRGR